jgi:regulator of replication initiation timing
MLDSDKKDIFNVMQELSNSMTRMDSEKEFIKESIMTMSEKYDIPKKNLKRVATIIHRQNISDFVTSNNDVSELYEDLTA